LTPRFLNYGRQLVEEDDLETVLKVLRSDFLTQGPAVELFEKSLCDYTGAKYAVAVSSGTAALHVASLAAGIKKDDIGLTSTLTFVASANAFLYCGGHAKVLDIDPYTLNFSMARLRDALGTSKDIKAVTPIHFGGLSTNTQEIREASGSRIVIEDASHSLGGRYESGRPVGNGAEVNMTVFSFHPVKPLTTGEGGAIMTNDLALYRRLKMFSNHGIERDEDRLLLHKKERQELQPNPWYYEQQELGYNYRMSDIHAALGHSQIKKLDRFISRRRGITAMYDEAFSRYSAIELPQSNPRDRHRSAHHLYVVEIDFRGLGVTRDAFIEQLRSKGVGGQIHYIPIHRQPYQKNRYKYDLKDFPVAETYYSKCLSLPIHPGLTDTEVRRVIKAVKSTIESEYPN
jgi:UDP-4-amino-4,6-dideoxy-N-acetyl-beta-L-altrosamine transaminase